MAGFKSSFGQPQKPKIVRNKGSKSQMLPSRHALATLTKGSPADRSIGMYGKLTPVGAGAPARYADIQLMGEKFERGQPKK